MAILAVLSLVIGACGDGDEASTDLEVTTTDFQFSPNSWTVPAGEEISIDITNDGSVLHEWVLMQPGVNIDSEADLPDTEEELLAEFVYVEDEVEAGANKTLSFTAPDAARIRSFAPSKPTSMPAWRALSPSSRPRRALEPRS